MVANFLKDFFNFSKSERIGIISLLFLFIFLLLLLYFFPSIIKPDTIPLASYDKDIQNLPKLFESHKKTTIDTKKTYPFHQKRQEISSFNPNELNAEDWQKLGFSQKQTETILNYKSILGEFRSKEDIASIYSISTSQYQKIKDFILLPEKKETKKKREGSTPSFSININTADTSTLEKLPGIGKILSKRIVRYREKLGGFYSINQLKEVHGIDTLTFSRIKKTIFTDTSLIKKINLNTASYQQLVSHPYLNSYDTKSILSFRKRNGNYESIQIIPQQKILPSETFNKTRIYLETR